MPCGNLNRLFVLIIAGKGSAVKDKTDCILRSKSKRPAAGRHKCRPLQFHCNVPCRGGACPSRNLSEQRRPNAEQINFSVGYGACDVPSFSATCHPNAKQIPVSVGMTIGHPQNDGRIRYRKRQIGIQCFNHADDRWSSLRWRFLSSTDAVCDPTPYSGTSTSAVPYKTHISSTNIHFIQRPAAGAPRRSPTNVSCRGGACPSRNLSIIFHSHDKLKIEDWKLNNE